MNIQEFAKLVEDQQGERLYADYMKWHTTENDRWNTSAMLETYKTHIHFGKKYDRIDVGTSGKFMITKDGHIYGIKAYGVIHKGHYYGTLDTVNEWYWGNYSPIRKA